MASRGSRERPLKIALVAPPWFAVPPNGYGGIERVVGELADGLVDLGHEVTLFASGGSRSRARVRVGFSEPPSAHLGNPVVEMRHLLCVYADMAGFDVIHDHTTLGLMAGAMLADAITVVHTVHGPVGPELSDMFGALPRSVHLVAISGAQQRALPRGRPSSLIYNGIPVTEFPFSAEHGKYLLFVGRMSPEKGPLEAIEIARRAGVPLRMLAKVNEVPEEQYFESAVQPALASAKVDVEFDVCEAHKREAYRDALATLFPINWNEPFGLVMTESMATGTPVIAFRRGSAPEVIDHGRTGFLCDSVDEAAEAVPRIRELDRAACRERVARYFSSDLNVRKHDQLYRRLAAARVGTKPVTASAANFQTPPAAG
jgi:glycosyltransferase involved in cell wall biosynthesis